MRDEIISAFAFKVGRDLEKLVEERNSNLSKELESLQSSVLSFRRELKDNGNTNMLKMFDLRFNIKETRDGIQQGNRG